MRLVLISDTHGFHGALNVPEGDVLIHAGDFTMTGEQHECESFARWLDTQPHALKIVIYGNHDLCYDPDRARGRQPVDLPAVVLNNSGIEYQGIQFWGSPVTPWFGGDIWAFNKHRGEEIKAVWDKIPSYTNVLITHGPPSTILDKTVSRAQAGCEDLANRVAFLTDLKLHVFGHIHEGYGREELGRGRYGFEPGPVFVNASSVDFNYRPVNKPITVEI